MAPILHVIHNPIGAYGFSVHDHAPLTFSRAHAIYDCFTAMNGGTMQP